MNNMINVIRHTKSLISPPLCISSVNKFSTIQPKKENPFTTYMLPRTLVPSTISLIYNPKGEVLHNPQASNTHPLHPHRANYITDLIRVPKSFIESTAANSLGAEKRKIRRLPRSPYA